MQQLFAGYVLYTLEGITFQRYTYVKKIFLHLHRKFLRHCDEAVFTININGLKL